LGFLVEAELPTSTLGGSWPWLALFPERDIGSNPYVVICTGFGKISTVRQNNWVIAKPI